MCRRSFFIFILSGLILFSSVVLSQEQGLTDAVSAWLFDEGSGTQADNFIQGGPDGTIVGNPIWVDGLYGKALQFDGWVDGVEIPSNPLVGAHSLTVQAYIKPTDTDFEGSKIFNIALQGEVGGVDRFMMDIIPNQGGWVFSHFMSIAGNRSDGEDDLSVLPVHAFGEWYHVAMVFDSTSPDGVKIKQYVNHALEHEWDYGFGVLGEGEAFIGERYEEKGSGLRDYFIGIMDNVVLHNKALTTETFMSVPGGVGVADEEWAGYPKDFVLHQNTPNPFNPETTLFYEIPRGPSVTVKLEVLNLIGQCVSNLVDEVQSGGRYSVRWEGMRDDGRLLPSGIYWYRLSVADRTLTRKMVLIR